MWLIFGVLTALGTSLQDILTRSAARSINRYVVIWAWWAFSLPWLWGYVLTQERPVVEEGFYTVVIAAAVCLTISVINYVKAVESGDLSLSVPILSFTPVMLLFTAPLITKEIPSLDGAVGILIMLIGTYFLFLPSGSKRWLEPLRRIFLNKGSRHMMVVVLMFSLAGSLDKVGTLKSSATFYLVNMISLLTAILTVLMLIKCRNIRQEFKKNAPLLIGIGLANALTYSIQLKGIVLTQVPYLIAIKRLSVLFSALYGIIILKEGDVKQRVIGIILMLIGVFVVSLAQ